MAQEKKKSKKKRVSQKYKLYEKSGDKLSRKNRFCPKCGAGVFMAKHANRYMCGNCHYIEMIAKSK